MVARGSLSRVLSVLVAVIAVTAALAHSPATARAGDAEAWWDAYNGPYDVIDHPKGVRAGCYTRQALMDNLWRYRYVGANENFVWYSDVVRIAANSGYNWAGRAWTPWYDGQFYFERCDTGFVYPTDTFTTWMYAGTFVARMCGNHTPSITSPPPPRVAGRIWHDYNGNGVIDAGEPGLNGWSVYLNRESSRLYAGNANANGDYNIAVDAVNGWYPNASFYTGPASVPAGWVVTKYPSGVYIPEGIGSAGATWWGQDIGVRQIIPPTTSLIASAPAPTGNAGWYRTPTTFTFSVSEQATTRYSIDATTPVTIWSSGSVSLPEGTHVVRYNSVDLVGDPEVVKSSTFKVDVSAPTAPSVGWYRTSLTSAVITWTPSTDSVSGLDGYKLIDLDSSQVVTTTAAGTTSATLTGLDPQHTYRIKVIATDVAGNESAGEVTFAIDNIAPVSTLHAVPAAPTGDAGWYVDQPDLSMSVNETATCFLGVDGPQSELTGTVTLGEGVHWVDYHAVDLANNIEETRRATFKVDLSAPEVSIAPRVEYLDDALVSLAATDSVSGLLHLTYRVDNGEWAEGTSAYVAGYGDHTVEACGTDVAGNTSVVRQDIRIVYSDTLAPVTTARGDIDGWVSHTATVTLSAEDVARPGEVVSGVDWTECYVNGARRDIKSLSFASDGVYALAYLSADRAGNIESTKSATVRVDMTAPKTTCDATATYSRLASITLDAKDDGSGVADTRFSFDGSAWSTGSVAATTAAGTHTLQFFSTDKVGNAEETQSVTFTLTYPTEEPHDTRPPVTTVLGVSGSWVRVPVAASLEATDDWSGVDVTYYIVGEGAQATYSVPIQLSAEGTTTLRYWSVDKAANREEVQSKNVLIDFTPPTVPGVPAWTVLTSDRVVLSWSASTDVYSGVDSYEVYDGTTLVATTKNCTVELSVAPSSEHGYSVRAVDRAGNISDPSSALDVIIPPIDPGYPIEPTSSAVATLLVPVYEIDRDRDHHQNGDLDAVMAPATIRITNVTAPGTLTVTWSENPPKDADPEFMFANEYYDVSFTGLFTGEVGVTLPYDPRWPDAKAKNFSLKHLVNGSWVDVPITVDLVNHTVTGVVRSLSPFAQALPAGTDLATRLIPSRSVAPFAGSAVHLSARLVDTSSTPLPGFTVVLERLRGNKWSFATTATPVPGKPGNYSAKDKPSTTGVTRYRFRFVAELFDGSVSPEIRVLTKARVSSRARVQGRNAKVTIGLEPKHGSVSLVIERSYRGHFKRVSSMKVGTTKGHATRTVKLRAGTYRYRLIHSDASHAKTISAWKKLIVR